MLKLEATLVAMTAVRTWRVGWSPDRGVDFIVRGPVRQTLAAAPDAGERIPAGEPVSFLEAEDFPASGTTIVRGYVSLAAEAAETLVRERADPPLTRAWSSLPRKVPGS